MGLSDRLRTRFRDVPDFPKPGILFKDITPLLLDPGLMRDVIATMADPYRDAGITRVVAMESRGFLFGVPLALELGTAFVPIRKPGKLPWRVERIQYDLEYGSDALEIHQDAIAPSDRVLVVDDVLATGGTAAAACRLVTTLGGQVDAVCVLLELAALQGRQALGNVSVRAMCTL